MPPKPKPFSRPSIDLGGEKREWRDVRVIDLAVGDTVAYLGMVQKLENHALGVEHRLTVTYGFTGDEANWHTESSDEDAVVKAFVRRT